MSFQSITIECPRLFEEFSPTETVVDEEIEETDFEDEDEE
jgi:hypothetical protein